MKKPLRKGGPALDENDFQEDGNGSATGRPAGRRDSPGRDGSSGGPVDQYLPDQQDGTVYEGTDQPGMSGPDGQTYEYKFEFIGIVIDPSECIAASTSWTVEDSGTFGN